jgi:hypothetical protein
MVATFSYSSGFARIYVNGSAVANAVPTGPAIVNSLPLRIGRYGPSLPKWFNGKMDDVRIYNRALSGSEVQQLYQSVNQQTCQLVVLGNPDNRGVPAPYKYGVYTVTPGTVINELISSPVSGGSGIRYVCMGWTGSGSIPASGTNTAVTATITTNSTLTWLWNTEYYLDTVVGSGGSVNGGDVWCSSGAGANLTAIALADYNFTGWTGDVPGGSSAANPLTVTMDQPRTITATFVTNLCSIGGQIFYTGNQNGTIYVEAFDDAGYVNRVGYTTMLSPGRYIISSLPAGRNYWVRAYVDGNGNHRPDDLEPIGGYSGNPISNLVASRGGIDIALKRLSAPQGLCAAGGADAIVLSWTANPEQGIAGYKVYRFNHDWLTFDLLNTAPVSGTEFVDDTVVVGETYYYCVTAVIRSDYTSSYMESPASGIVCATAGTVVLWMPDYNGTTGSVVRLRINAADARGILAKDMSITVSYDPSVLMPLSQFDVNQATVERTALTEGLAVLDNGKTATGQITITATDLGAGTNHATLHILGCNYETEMGTPTSEHGQTKVPGIIKGSYSLDGGATWVDINDGMNINDGRSYSIDLGDIANATNCLVCVEDVQGGVYRYSHITNECVKILRNGDNMGAIERYTKEPVCSYLDKYVDQALNVHIGANDALYLFELTDMTGQQYADYQDVVAYIEYDQGKTLDGEGHLFDVLFKVADVVPQGRQVTNRFVTVSLKNADGNTLAVDCSDTAVFSAQGGYILGDINGDGVVDVSGDFTLAMKLAVGQRSPTAYELMAGDIDGDGHITKADASLIKRIAKGECINPEPVGSGGGPSGTPSGSGYQLSIGNFEAVLGSSVQIPINISNAKDIASLNLRVNYDQSVLTLQNVTNAALTSSFGVEYLVGAGYVDIVLCNDKELVSGSGAILYLNCLVKPGAVIGSMSDLTISDKGVANQYGKDIGLKSGVGVSNGGATVVMSDLVDSDHDGISDYKEEMADGLPGYSPWDPVNNPLGGDTDMYNPDTDNDGMPDGDEIVAGTSSTDPDSRLEVLNVQKQGTNGLKLEWLTSTSRVYTIEYSTNILQGFVPLETNIVGTGALKLFTDPASPAKGARFYRIKVREQ